jgi:hypothetical protein
MNGEQSEGIQDLQHQSAIRSGTAALSREDRHNRLEYLADMISEMQALARDCGGSTLQGLLLLASSEARLEVKRLQTQDDTKANAVGLTAQAKVERTDQYPDNDVDDETRRRLRAALNDIAQD